MGFAVFKVNKNDVIDLYRVNAGRFGDLSIYDPEKLPIESAFL